MRNPSCTKCELHKFTRYVCAWGDGPETAQIMLVGEALGAEEEKVGRPFVGAAGAVLDKALGEAGLKRSEVYISNIAKCRPPQNRTPHQEEQDACLPYLIQEIETVKPKVIVALGGTALKSLTGQEKITVARGKPFQSRKGLFIDAPIIGTLHPAATLRPGGTSYYPMIVEDLRRARTLVDDKPSGERKLIHPPWHEDGDIIESLKLLQECRPISVDLEWTSGTDAMIWPWSNRGEIYTISFTGRTPQGLVSVAIAYPLSPRVRSVLSRLLANRPIVFHNAMADTLWTDADGFEVQLAGDTMLLAWLLDETQPLKLEAVATKYGGVQGGWKGHLFQQRPQTDQQWIELLTYNTDDTSATLLGFEGLREAIKTLPQERQVQILRLHKNMLLPGLQVLQRAARYGIPIDVDRLKHETAEAKKRQIEAAQDLADITGTTLPQAMKMATSQKKVQEYFAGLGLELDSTRKDELTKLTEFPAAAAMLRIRAEQKRLSTYFEPWLRMIERQGDGRLHSVYRMTGTRTGRLSAESEEGGSIQVAPRDDDLVKFRMLIRATAGRKLVSADYSQAELRVIAWQANEKNMLRFYAEGIDLHYATAAYVLFLQENGAAPIERFWDEKDGWIAKVTKPQRQAAKPGNFGLCYGMGEDSLREYARTQYGVIMSPEEAHIMHTGYFRLYSALPGWQQRSMEDAARRGRTETPFGRWRTFDPNDVHAAINTPIQSIASDFTMLAMIDTDRRLREEGLDAFVIGFVHDSILIDASDRDAERAKQILEYSMENVDTKPWGFTMPIKLPADGKIGQTWSGD